MRLRHDERHAVGCDFFRVQIRWKHPRAGFDGDADIDLFLAQAFVDAARRKSGDFEQQGWRKIVKRPDQAGCSQRGHARAQAHGEDASFGSPQQIGGFAQPLKLEIHLFGFQKERQAGVGRFNALPRPPKDLETDLQLQLPDLFADSRL